MPSDIWSRRPRRGKLDTPMDTEVIPRHRKQKRDILSVHQDAGDPEGNKLLGKGKQIIQGLLQPGARSRKGGAPDLREVKWKRREPKRDISTKN